MTGVLSSLVFAFLFLLLSLPYLLCQTKNENYVVTQLPTTPERLHNNQNAGIVSHNFINAPSNETAERWHGAFSVHIGYAVAMTQHQAIVWRYFQGTNPKDSFQPLIINLQHSRPDARAPLPFGLVVPTAAEPAFLVVTASDGYITYWESLSSAASIDPNRQKQQGVQGAIGGMISGEVITKVTEAEPHGFLLTFSTGRVAHITVCDPHGKPSINAQYLRDSGSYTSGLFGSLKSVFNSAGWRRNVAAVKAGSSWQRGQRYAVVATTKGVFQVWDLNWNGTHSLVSEIDAKEDLLETIQQGENVAKETDHHLFRILDFVFLPAEGKGKEHLKSAQGGDCKLLVLTALSGPDDWRYSLIGLTLSQGSLDIDVVHQIRSYKTPLPAESSFGPELLVPEMGQTAFVVFEKNILLFSLSKVEESPSSQLQIEAHTLPFPFEDVLDFHKAKSYTVVGCAAEPHDRTQTYTSCVLMVYGFGVVRVAALPTREGQSALDRATVTARTKLEQAVFYGNLQQDLLDFSGRAEISFDKVEVQKAALAVSDSIMRSTSVYISAIGPSVDQQLHRRSTALADLIKHLKKNHKPLDRLTRWKLLWDAEKMAAAAAIWKSYNLALATKGDDGKNLLTEIVERLHEDFKVENNPERFETDPVRHWFTHDIWRLEFIIPWAQHAVEQLFRESIEDNVDMDTFTKARLVSEANDIQLSALETAFFFREAHAALYGVENEVMIDGVLKHNDDYEGLPEIWTSSLQIVPKVKVLVDLSRELALAHEDLEDEPTARFIERLVENNPRLVQICCQTYIERFRWLKTRNDRKSQNLGMELQEEHFRVRRSLFVKLSDIEQGQEGIRLADKYREMDALVEIIDHGLQEEIQRGKQAAGQDSEKEDAARMVKLLRSQINSYFKRFGKSWANAYFAKHIQGGNSITILNEASIYDDTYQLHLNAFLRQPMYAKLCWINEVRSARDFSAAAYALKAAEKEETSLWGKKIKLSMGKLALLATKSRGQVADANVDSDIKNFDRKLAVVGTQEQIYQYIRPTLTGAIDAVAENQLAVEQYCKRYVKERKEFAAVLHQNIEKLLSRQALDLEELIDTITLMDEDGLRTDKEEFGDKRFFSALKLVKLSSFEDGELARKDFLEKVIWRRCMIQDDWVSINHTELKDDTQVEVDTGATALFKTLREGYITGL